MQTISKAISIDKVFFKYEKDFVLEDINLQINEKDFITILGPNGGGKSTLIKLILGINQANLILLKINTIKKIIYISK